MFIFTTYSLMYFSSLMPLIEIIEAINFLKGDMPKDLKEVILELGSQMIKASRNGDDIEENKIIMINI